MELIEKLKKQLSEEYGIHSDQELICSKSKFLSNFLHYYVVF